MKIKKNEKLGKQRFPNKHVPIIKTGTYKKLTIALWILLIASMSFGIYKNFTAIDMHTVHEKEIIEKQVIDTNKVESFTESFVREYYSWQQSQEAIDNRNERLKSYLTEELQQLNLDMVRSDIPTTATVSGVQIWSVEQECDKDYAVIFSVVQQITEQDKKASVVSTYRVVVHVDADGNMVIIKNPTLDSKPQKSDYQSKQVESDGTVDTTTSEEIGSFLETFFKLYPSASEKELAYYVSNNALPVVQKDYVFAELINPVYSKKDNLVTATVTVKYLDQETKTTHLSQYTLTLEKQDNWKIVK